MDHKAIDAKMLVLQENVIDLMKEWQQDNALFWASHPEVTMRAIPDTRSGDRLVGGYATMTEHARALNSIAHHVLEGRGFDWEVVSYADGAGHLTVFEYNEANDVRKD